MTCDHSGLPLFEDPCHDCYATEDGSFSGWEVKSDLMDPEAFKNEMNELATSSSWDKEDCHRRMDALMCEVLRSIGYDDGIDIFEATSKWYA
jgi:hypothetical protein